MDEQGTLKIGSHTQNLSGQRFGMLEVLSFAGKKNGNVCWTCRCDCGAEKVILATCLKSGSTKSCGCAPKNWKDLTGRRFERLTVLGLDGMSPDGRNRLWKCRCDCGVIRSLPTGRLLAGHVRSCGCLQREVTSRLPRKKNPEGRMTSSRLYKHRKALGLCPGCGGPPDDGRVMCSFCRLKSKGPRKEFQQRLRDGRRKAGACLLCGGQRDTDAMTCSGCLERQRKSQKEYRQRLRGEGWCTYCKKEFSAGQTVCRFCSKKASDLRKSRVLQGLCARCGAKAEVGEKWTMCLTCWFKSKSLTHTGTIRNWERLRDLFDRQGRRCFYTGEPLVPGVNASIDHKLPKAKGGTGDLGNLHWITDQVNTMKNDCTHEEFLGLCRLIAGRFPGS